MEKKNVYYNVIEDNELIRNEIHNLLDLNKYKNNKNTWFQ